MDSPAVADRRRVSFSAIVETVREFMGHRPMDLSAAVSYYTLLSLAPIVLVAVSVTGLLFRREAVEVRIVREMRGLVGESGAEVIQDVLRNASDPGKSTLSLVIGLVTLLAGATTVFVQLQDSLNRIWDVEAKPKKSAIWSFVRERLLSLAMVFGVGFLLLVSLLVSTALSALGDWAGFSALDSPAALRIVDTAISIGVVTLLFAMMFKYLPDAEVAWRDVWFGAIATSVLFTMGKYLIGLYLGRASVGSSYGAAGSIVVLLVWIYYASLIFFFGAELTHVASRRVHGRVTPTEHATRTAHPAAR
jgi:membrane protein